MGWENPPVPWRELQRRMTWGTPENTKTQATNGVRLSRSASASLSRPHGPPWAELHCHSSFSFLDGAATPAELVSEAARLGLETLALTDHDGMYGVPQFAQAAARLRDQGTPLATVFGAELSLGATGPQEPDPPGSHLLVLAKNAEGYRRLCAVISAAQLAAARKTTRSTT